MIKPYRSPFLGAAYYPEDWGEDQIAHDIAKMREAGITCARMGEFAWSMMEPVEGQFDFAWLRRVIDRLDEAGIAVILGTPTATPPIWLSQKYPDVTVLNEHYVHVKHGGRRHCCSNHPAYLTYSMRIVEEMAKAFGDDERVIGWQIDNEINIQDCRCEHCQAAFRAYLQDKYGTIEALNKAWNLNLFNQHYNSFSEIPYPDYGWHNPHIKLELRLFQGQTQYRFVKAQIEILRRYTKAPIGTDTMPINKIDHEQLTEYCDIIQYNHYDPVEGLPTQRFWFDYMRTLGDRPFWNTETSTCWNGSVATPQTLKPYGFCRINSWLPVALGGEAAMYWPWRTHHAGHEMMHGSVLYASGRPMHTFPEVQQVAREFETCADFIKSTRVESEVALHFSSLSWNLFEYQALIKDFTYQPTLYKTFYRPIVKAGLRPDVIGPRHELTGYKVLFSPLMMTLEEGDLPERITAWVREGGIWVVGPMTDIRSAWGARYADRLYGMLESLTGVHPLYEIPDREGMIKCHEADGTPFGGSEWYELYEADEHTLATVSQGYPSLVGTSVLQRIPVGKGFVYLLGTLPEEGAMGRLLDGIIHEAALRRYEIEGEIAVVPRRGEEIEGLIVAECRGEAGAITLPEAMTDLLTGKTLEGRVALAPYDLLVLQK